MGSRWPVAQERPQRSDQLPEEAPAEQVPDDAGQTGQGGDDETKDRSDGGAEGARRQSTGNPDNAG